MVRKKLKGFTLIEMIIAIAIIALLASIAIPTYTGYAKKARYAEMSQALIPYRKAVDICYQATGNLNTCGAGQNGVPPNFYFGAQTLVGYVFIFPGGTLFAFPNNLHGFNMVSDYLLLQARVLNNTLQWQYGGPGANYI